MAKDKDKEREDYYKGEDWVSQGDGYVYGGAPHLDEKYRCICGGMAMVAAVLRDNGPVVDVLAECSQCKASYVVVASKKDLGPLEGL